MCYFRGTLRSPTHRDLLANSDINLTIESQVVKQKKRKELSGCIKHRKNNARCKLGSIGKPIKHTARGRRSLDWACLIYYTIVSVSII